MEESVVSRQQRVMEAKAAFSDKNRDMGYSTRRGAASVAVESGEYLTEEEYSLHEKWRIRRLFSLLRFMMAAAMALVLMAAFSHGFSYHGFDQEYVQQRLEDETSWNRLEQKVQSIYLNLLARD